MFGFTCANNITSLKSVNVIQHSAGLDPCELCSDICAIGASATAGIGTDLILGSRDSSLVFGTLALETLAIHAINMD
jgi:hypothetical protein